jgi:hypothetical protein
MIALLTLAAFLLLVLAAIVWDGFAMYKLWGWFAVPVGAPHLSLAHVIGLSLLAGIFVGTNRLRPNKATKGDWKEAVAQLVLAPAFAIGLGYVIKLAAHL